MCSLAWTMVYVSRYRSPWYQFTSQWEFDWLVHIIPQGLPFQWGNKVHDQNLLHPMFTSLQLRPHHLYQEVFLLNKRSRYPIATARRDASVVLLFSCICCEGLEERSWSESKSILYLYYTLKYFGFVFVVVRHFGVGEYAYSEEQNQYITILTNSSHGHNYRIYLTACFLHMESKAFQTEQDRLSNQVF